MLINTHVNFFIIDHNYADTDNDDYYQAVNVAGEVVATATDFLH